ncbi:unnamed protein product [Blepharisma stoltei]|uniref:Nose resistant-to-fluoxetine protein N-terminal domain-containing protein n=1 Tax=Blepharisma stoltei TaxID=1481888 RepID=A0AAU9J2D0_9CILI|nr:unnamed protein product [Blepharisma stoltei]
MKLIITLLWIISTFANLEKCKQSLESDAAAIVQFLTGNLTSISPVKRLYYSGRDSNDLGLYNLCLGVEDSQYLLLRTPMDILEIYLGLCVPKDCDADSIKSLIRGHPNPHLDLSILKASNMNFEINSPTEHTLSAFGGFIIAITFFFAILVFAGTLIEHLDKPKKQKIIEEEKEIMVELTEKSEMVDISLNFPQKTNILSPKLKYFFINCSMIKNWEKLFDTKFNENLKIFDGIRVMSLGWVILVQVFLARVQWAVINAEDIPYIFGWASTAFDYGGFYAVDTFVWICGFFMGYLSLKEIQNFPKSFRWGFKTLRKIAKTVPAYIFILAFVVSVVPTMGSGPNWHFVDEYLTKDCEKYWWANLLFLNNFIPGGMGSHCISQTWYIASELQLFLFGIFFITIYCYYPKKFSWILASVVFLSEFVLRIILAAEYEISIAFVAEKNVTNETNQIFFVKPYCRVTVYLFGFLSAIIYLQSKSERVFDGFGKQIVGIYQEKRFGAVLSFAIGLGLLNLQIFGQMPCYSDKDNDFQGYSRTGNILSFATNGFFIGLSYSMMFLPLLLDYLSIITSFLSWKGWIPFSNLTFSTFLVHLAVVYGLFSAEEYGYVFTTLNQFSDFIYILFCSYFFGLVLYLLIEAPFKNFLTNIFSRPKNTQDEPLLLVNP